MLNRNCKCFFNIFVSSVREDKLSVSVCVRVHLKNLQKDERVYFFVRDDSFKGRLLSLLDTERLSIGTTKNLTLLLPSCSYRQSGTSLLSPPTLKNTQLFIAAEL